MIIDDKTNNIIDVINSLHPLFELSDFRRNIENNTDLLKHYTDRTIDCAYEELHDSNVHDITNTQIYADCMGDVIDGIISNLRVMNRDLPNDETFTIADIEDMITNI